VRIVHFFTRLIKWTFCVLASLLVCLLIIGFFFFPKCDGDSPKADYARSISKDRLEMLYLSLVKIKTAHEEQTRAHLRKAGIDYFDMPLNISYEKSPDDIKDIEFINIRISKHSSRIMLEGCFDHFLMMNIKGLYGEENPKIELNWGEFKSWSETLWEK